MRHNSAEGIPLRRSANTCNAALERVGANAGRSVCVSIGSRSDCFARVRREQPAGQQANTHMVAKGRGDQAVHRELHFAYN